MKSLTRGHYKAAVQTLRANRGRSFLTMLGIIIGVVSVISIVSIGEGVKQQITGQINHFGKDLITVRPAHLSPTGQSGGALGLFSTFSVASALSDKDYVDVGHASHVAVAVPLSIVSGEATGDNPAPNSPVIGTSENLPRVLNQQLQDGGFFTEDDAGTNVAVLGAHVATRLFNDNVPLGRSFTLRGQQFMVRGVFNEFTNAPLSPETDFNNAIFIPYTTAQEITDHTSPIYEILAKPPTGQQTDAAVASITAALAKTHGGAQGFEVLKSDESLAASNSVLDLLTRLIGGIAAISLLVGGIGIMNVMLVSVTERMHEIGIRKAVGATNRQILNQFIVEATVLSMAGGLIGIAMSFVIDVVLRLFTTLEPVIRWQVVVLATAVAVVVGIVFGSAPALKAARKDPIQALRNE